MEEVERIHKETINKMKVEHQEIIEKDKNDTQSAMRIMKQYYESQLVEKPDESENNDIDVFIILVIFTICKTCYFKK